MYHPTQTNRMAKQILRAAIFQWDDKRYSLRAFFSCQPAEAALEGGSSSFVAHSSSYLGVCPSNALPFSGAGAARAVR